jgi:hypothetical protein
MTTVELVARDIYLRHTATNGTSYVQHHRVWDADRFIAAQKSAAEKLNRDTAADQPRKAKAEQITETQYRLERTA